MPCGYIHCLQITNHCFFVNSECNHMPSSLQFIVTPSIINHFASSGSLNFSSFKFEMHSTCFSFHGRFPSGFAQNEMPLEMRWHVDLTSVGCPSKATSL